MARSAGTISSDKRLIIADIFSSYSQVIPSTEWFGIYIEGSITGDMGLTWKRWMALE